MSITATERAIPVVIDVPETIGSCSLLGMLWEAAIEHVASEGTEAINEYIRDLVFIFKLPATPQHRAAGFSELLHNNIVDLEQTLERDGIEARYIFS